MYWFMCHNYKDKLEKGKKMQKRNDLNFNEFKEILQKRSIQVEESIAQLRSELDSTGTDEGVEDREELASLSILNNEDNAILAQQEKEREEIIHALGKIKNGTFGICEKSAEPIPVERLRVNPIARFKVGIEK